MRTVSTVALIAFAAYTIFLAPTFFAVIAIALVSFLATRELILAQKNQVIHRFMYVFCMISALLPISIYQEWNVYLFLVTMAIMLIVALYLIKFEEINFKDVTTTIAACTILPIAINSLTNIYLLENGKYLILVPMICASASDIFAYLTGKSIGKHKLAPKISPNKTIEGAIGGIIGSIVVVSLYAYFTYDIIEIGLIPALFIGVLGAVFGQMGDLFFSMIKRQVGIKDFSNTIPGHGGILDRLDSMIFTSSITYAILIL